MHLKTIRHQGKTIKKLLEYMVDGMENKDTDMMIAHNLPTMEVNTMAAAFIANDSYRRSPARVRWYHEVLSFSPLDREHINEHILDDIARKYIQMRNPNALCFSVAHMDKAHIHLHFCFSGVEYRNKKTLRMDDDTFRDLRLGIEHYQMQQYPQLKNSIVYIGKEKTKGRAVKRDTNARKEREYQAKRRLGKQSTEKEQSQQAILEAFNTAKSTTEFYGFLQTAGLELNYRNGKVNGVKGKRTYRFVTLGVDAAMMQSLNKLEKRMQEYDALKGTAPSIGRER